VNRSYQDVMNFKTMAAQNKDEAELLWEHYPILSNKCGTPYLADTSNRLYLEQNQNFLAHDQTRSSWIKPAWPLWTSKTKKELSYRSSRNSRPTVAPGSSKPSSSWRIFSVFSNFEKIRYCRTLSVRLSGYYFSGGWPIFLFYGSIDSL
jgi:hypothetical protein